jgi:hypothetical protein
MPTNPRPDEPVPVPDLMWSGRPRRRKSRSPRKAPTCRNRVPMWRSLRDLK